MRDALLAVKYHRNIGLADAIATDMLGFARSLQWMMEMLIPVPSGAMRLRERGYNQVALIARPLAYELGVAYAPNGLRRARETRSQVGLNASERRENVRGAYRADPSVVERKSILLIDDVATTGATISACAEALVAAGATEVRALTIARAHARHDLDRV
ncbi:MAG: ComF family protein [Anaerolineales bacterium]|nr:ComF family protein [Anaerolineales bacterium]MCL4260953.1 ComF family protein [Anaerolineales bacterium]